MTSCFDSTSLVSFSVLALLSACEFGDETPADFEPVAGSCEVGSLTLNLTGDVKASGNCSSGLRTCGGSLGAGILNVSMSIAGEGRTATFFVASGGELGKTGVQRGELRFNSAGSTNRATGCTVRINQNAPHSPGKYVVSGRVTCPAGSGDVSGSATFSTTVLAVGN